MLGNLSGPQHYRCAETFLHAVAIGRDLQYGDHLSPAKAADYVARAGVHATLALAAATALNDGSYGLDHIDRAEWSRCAGSREVPTSPGSWL